MAEINVQDYAPLIKTWGELRDSAVWAAVVLGLFVAICFIVYYVIQYKKTKTSEDSKNNRAAKLASSNEKLANSLNNLKSALESHIKTEEGEIWPIIDNLKTNIKSLTNKMTGIVGIHDSLNIIRLTFFKAIYFEIRECLYQWVDIKEADFRTREQFISDTIRTDIGEILSKYKNTLSNFKLSINQNLFFKLDSTESKERFILVDIIWSELKIYYTSQSKPEQKYEECSLRLFNIIKDYVNTIITEIDEESSIGSNGSGSSHHVPVKSDTKEKTESIKPKSLYSTPLPFKISDI